MRRAVDAIANPAGAGQRNRRVEVAAQGIADESYGRVAEWLKAPDSKSDVVARLPWVRIPPLPPV